MPSRAFGRMVEAGAWPAVARPYARPWFCEHVVVHGRPVALPDHDWITDVPLETKTLKADMTLVFETAGDGYPVDMASIVLDAPVK